MREKILTAFAAASLLLSAAEAGSADSFDKIAKKISQGGKSLQNKKVAVLPFPYHDGRESKGSTIVSERLITKLVEQRKLEVIERALMEKVLKELKLQASGAIDEQSAKQIGKILGVEAIVSGTLIDLGEQEVEVNARLIRAETGQIVTAVSGQIERMWKDAPAAEDKAARSAQAAKPADESSSTDRGKVLLVTKRGYHPSPSDASAGPDEGGEPIVMGNKDARGGKRYPHPSDERMPPPPYEGDEGHEPHDWLLVESELGHVAHSPVGRGILEGVHMIKSGRAADAEQHFKSLHESLADDPRLDAVARLGYSMSLFAQGREKEAFGIAKSIAEQDRFPRVSSVANFILGKFGEKSGRIEAAKHHYLEVVRNTPFQGFMVRAAGRRLRELHANRREGGPGHQYPKKKHW